MTKPTAHHNYPPEKFPITMCLRSGKTDKVVWSRKVTLDEAHQLAQIKIPSFAGTEHFPVRSEIIYADGLTWAEVPPVQPGWALYHQQKGPR